VLLDTFSAVFIKKTLIRKNRYKKSDSETVAFWMPPLVAKLCCTHLVHQESFCFSSFPCQKVLFFIFLMSFGYPFTSCLLSYFLSLIRFAVLTVRRDDHPYLIGSLPI